MKSGKKVPQAQGKPKFLDRSMKIKKGEKLKGLAKGRQEILLWSDPIRGRIKKNSIDGDRNAEKDSAYGLAASGRPS